MQPGEPGVNVGRGWGREKRKRKRNVKRGRESSGNGCSFGFQSRQLIFKQQAGGVLVTDKDPGLSSHSLTSSHSALLSGRHLESGKQLRARREKPPRGGGGGGAAAGSRVWVFF